VARAAARLGLRGRSILVAASGGVDSTALAALLAELAPRLSLDLSLGHVHHGLRGADADADLAAVKQLGARLALPVRVAEVRPRDLRAAGPSRSRPTLQEAARTLRYRALVDLAGPDGWVATAHTADDQAETVLLRLLRGTGPDGLAGIPERSHGGRVVRPLLAVCRPELEAWARARGLAWREDASNASPRYARNRLRHDWLPGLRAAFNPRLLRAIADLAEAQRRDSEWIGTAVKQEASRRLRAQGGALWIDAGGWTELPEALGRRLIRAALACAGLARDVRRTHLVRISDFLADPVAGRTLELPGGVRLVADRRGVRLTASRGISEVAC
jgi:tRNA(Ile)-lysidine synthase